MICRLFFAVGAVAIAAMAAGPLRAEEPAPAPTMISPQAAAPTVGSSPGHASAAISRAAPRPEEPALATHDTSKEGGNAVADEPALAPASSAESAEAAPPAEKAEGSAMPEPEEAAEAKEEAEPSPQDQPAAAASAPSRSTERPVISNSAGEPSRKALNVPAVAPAEAEALRKALSSLPDGASDEERNERAALISFYESRGYAPLWLKPDIGFNAKSFAAAAEIKRSRDFGLDPRDFPMPPLLITESATSYLSPDEMAAFELKISLAILKYGRYARGGRIIVPSEQLSSYLDRRPQLLKPQAILDGIAAADEPDAYLRGLHPKHPQFEKLRQKYLALGGHGKHEGSEAKRLLANMEEWRWMPENLGDVYVWNNIPEFTQRVVKDGALVRKEAIVVGQIHKETPIFSRALRKITFKPTWIVPDSIKVRELLPNLMQGGGSLMSHWGLEMQKDGQPVNWRKVNWANTDIRTYDVIQTNGSLSVMGKVKFSFPSQHTVFMHDAAEGEKWMFNAPKRTYSHGCMRVHNPVDLAEILLRADKGWDAAKTKEVLKTGGNNNEIPIEHRIMVHMTYFTALVDDDGRLHTFPDVYDHEHRITLALEGKWSQIEKGRDHLAPVELNEAKLAPRHRQYEEAYEQPAPLSGAPARSDAARTDPPRTDPPRSTSFGSSFLDSLFGRSSSSFQQYPAAPRPYQYR